jgi:hypothetical protein
MKTKKKKKISKYWVGETVYIQGIYKAVILKRIDEDNVFVKILEGIGGKRDSGRGTFKINMLTKKRIKA